MSNSYPVLENPDAIPTPGLWVDKQAVQRNIYQMVSDIGGVDCINRLRPHIKTHKMLEVVQMQVAAGIKKCKAATLAEAVIAAEGGVDDILIAHQLVGPKVQQLASLVSEFPNVNFSTVVDDPEFFGSVADELPNVGFWIDVDCGMHRSGIELGSRSAELQKLIGERFRGLHVYDGHLHDPSLADRTLQANRIIDSVHEYLSEYGDVLVVGGGTPTFGVWAKGTEWECSPGTTVFWDCGYGENYPDLDYDVAAGLVTRIISRPGRNQLCFDLGHKSVAAEMELAKRVIFPELSEYQLIGQSEEHLVVEVPDSSRYQIGQAFTAIPRHICPTVALHAYANEISTNQIWQVAARNRLQPPV